MGRDRLNLEESWLLLDISPRKRTLPERNKTEDKRTYSQIKCNCLQKSIVKGALSQSLANFKRWELQKQIEWKTKYKTQGLLKKARMNKLEKG